MIVEQGSDLCEKIYKGNNCPGNSNVYVLYISIVCWSYRRNGDGIFDNSGYFYPVAFYGYCLKRENKIYLPLSCFRYIYSFGIYLL